MDIKKWLIGYYSDDDDDEKTAKARLAEQQRERQEVARRLRSLQSQVEVMRRQRG